MRRLRQLALARRIVAQRDQEITDRLLRSLSIYRHHPARLSVWVDHVGQSKMTALVRKKSAMKIAMEMTTTVRVVLLPTPAVPPVVFMPKWQPTNAMMAPKNGVLMRPAMKSIMVTEFSALW